MQNAINPLVSIAEDRAVLIERSHEAARLLDLEPDPAFDAILARYKFLPETEI